MSLKKTKKRENTIKDKTSIYTKGSAGEVMTYSVEPRIVALLMAIVAEKTEMPLNQIKFISIKEISE